MVKQKENLVTFSFWSIIVAKQNQKKLENFQIIGDFFVLKMNVFHDSRALERGKIITYSVLPTATTKFINFFCASPAPRPSYRHSTAAFLHLE